MRRRAVTILEIIIVMAILGILSALAFPTIASARIPAQIQVSKSNLRQQWLALQLYREATDEVYGSTTEMNLPDSESLFLSSSTPLGLPDKVWRSPCGKHPQNIGDDHYRWMLQKDEGTVKAFKAAAILYEDNLIVSYDVNCNPADVNVSSAWQKKRALGILLSGVLISKTAIGSPDLYEWWAAPKY